MADENSKAPWFTVKTTLDERKARASMGWYHNEVMNGSPDPSVGADGTCSLPLPDPALEVAAQEEIYDGDGRIYHLCRRDSWMKAIESHEVYFPPTFWSDGRFTRGSCAKNTLVHTANTYYKADEGQWLCLELDPAILRRLGIAIAVHRAPETAANGQPAQCLKLYGGISVTTISLIQEIYAVQRGSDGTFLGMLPDDGAPRMTHVEKAVKAARLAPTIDTPEHPPSLESKQPPKRGLWQRIRPMK